MTTKDSQELPEAGRFEISIVGETNLDLILYGLPRELPLEREVLGSGFQLTLGGSSSILAHNLAVLGSRVGFSTMLGSDEMGEIALAKLQASGVDTSHVLRSQTSGTGVTVLLPHGKERRILTYPGVMTELTVDMLDRPYLQSSRHLHLSSLFLQTGLHAGLPSLLSELRSAGMTVSLDTNDDPEDDWGGVLPDVLDCTDLLLPNEHEAMRMTQTQCVEEALDALAPRIATIVVKCGSRGAVVQQGANRTWIKAHHITPVDTIGAGDSFDAGFLHAWLQGATAEEAAAFGNRTGALSTLRSGGTEAFLDPALRDLFLAGGWRAAAAEAAPTSAQVQPRR